MPHCLQPGQGVPVTPDHWMMDLFFCFMKLKLSYFLINPGRGHLALHKVLALAGNTPLSRYPGSDQRALDPLYLLVYQELAKYNLDNKDKSYRMGGVSRPSLAPLPFRINMLF